MKLQLWAKMNMHGLAAQKSETKGDLLGSRLLGTGMEKKRQF